ncbi:AAA family ATPase [Sandaracinomonas limnophila]|nr:AAA family ATPase [Sandaracinomonas limnophila]
MKESILIQNFGPLKEVNIEEIKPFTVVIGESGSGKSTLMKCISLFRYIFKMENIRSYLKNSKISKSPFRFHIVKHFKYSGLEEFLGPNTRIIYKVKFESGEEIIIKYSDKKLYRSNLISSKNLHFTKVSFITENRNIIPLWASRSASLAGAYLGFYFHEVFKDFELASDILKSVQLNHVGLKFISKKTNKGKEYKIESINSDFELEFKNSSSGIQSSAPITLISKYFASKFEFEDAFNRSVLSYLSSIDSLTDFRPTKNLSELGKKIYIHIEEPELSLFPDAQFKLMEELIRDCFMRNENDMSLFISTHSPYIINHLNLMIKSYDENSEEFAQYDYSKLGVYQVSEGRLQDLIIQNERLVNTNSLSDTINDIYNSYNSISKITDEYD